MTEYTETVIVLRDTKTGAISRRTLPGDHKESITIEWTSGDEAHLISESRKGG